MSTLTEETERYFRISHALRRNMPFSPRLEWLAALVQAKAMVRSPRVRACYVKLANEVRVELRSAKCEVRSCARL